DDSSPTASRQRTDQLREGRQSARRVEGSLDDGRRFPRRRPLDVVEHPSIVGQRERLPARPAIDRDGFHPLLTATDTTSRRTATETTSRRAASSLISVTSGVRPTG